MTSSLPDIFVHISFDALKFMLLELYYCCITEITYKTVVLEGST